MNNILQPCQTCTMQYNTNQKLCPFCDTPNPFLILPVLDKPSKSKLSCHKCNFQNDLSNTQCVACDAFLYQKQEQKNKKKCNHCGQMIFEWIIGKHQTDCLLSLEVIKEHQREIKEFEKNQVDCRYCSLSVPYGLIDQHNQVCEKKPKPVIKPVIQRPLKPFIRPPPHYGKLKPSMGGFIGKIPMIGGVLNPQPYQQIIIPQQIKQNQLFDQNQIKRLSKLQINAIMYMQAKSLKQHKSVQKQLQLKTSRLGFKKADLQNLLFYIQNYAPIIIHVHITKHMEFFVKDTHYRNQFQTGKSSGTLSRQTRTEWQNRMFDKKYATATDHQRVKYGVINFTNDPKGVNCALAYGQSYFLLKQHVRNRCTLTDMDSSNAASLIGTFKFCFHILNKMNDKQLTSAFNAAKALQQSSTVTTTYKQIQIHGPIQFSKDIQRIYVNKKQVQNKTYLDMVYKFCEKNKIEYEFI